MSTSWWRDLLLEAWSQPHLRWLGAILLLAAVLRIVWVLYAAREPQGFHDQLFYMFYGEQIANGNGYRLMDGSPTAYYPIGYPAALGGVFFLVLNTPIPDNLVLTAGFFQVFLGVATVALVYEVGRRLFNPSVGLVAAFLLAAFPNLIFHTGTYLSETLFNFLVMAALVVVLSTSWRERRLGRGRLLLFGALLGLSALVRPISLLFLPLLVIAWLWAGFGWRRTLEQTGTVLAVTVIVIMPWAIRNAVVMKAPIIISANTGDDLCMGHYPGAGGHFALPDHCFAGYEGLERPEYEVRRNNDNIGRAIRFAVSHPATEVRLLFWKAYYLMEHDHDGAWATESYGDDPFIGDGREREVLWYVADIFFFGSVTLGLLGAPALLRPREPPRLFFLLALLALGGVPLAFFGDARFHVPTIPLLVVLAAIPVEALLSGRLWKEPDASPTATAQSAAGERPSEAVEVAEGETSVAEQDTLKDA